MTYVRRCLFFILSSLSLALSANDYKIMFLGDSITEGSVGPDYRCYLLDMLKSTGHSFDSVGSRNSNTPSCDSDHEGHSGWRTDHIIPELAAWTSTYNPDIALIHLGTNDIWQGNDVLSTSLEIAQLINIFRMTNPHIVIFVAGIVPINVGDRNQEVIALNALIKDHATQTSTNLSPIFFVDHHTNFNTDMLFDGVHPDDYGAFEMAYRWFKMLDRYFVTLK